MDRMNYEDNETKLDAARLFAEYRDAIQEPDTSTTFMPGLWQKIEARRKDPVFALDTLFAEYRQAVPDPEPSPSFMPGLWKRIDARRD